MITVSIPPRTDEQRQLQENILFLISANIRLVTDIINITKKVKTNTFHASTHFKKQHYKYWKSLSNIAFLQVFCFFSKFSPEYPASNNYSITFILSIQKPFDLAFLHTQKHIDMQNSTCEILVLPSFSLLLITCHLLWTFSCKEKAERIV